MHTDQQVGGEPVEKARELLIGILRNGSQSLESETVRTQGTPTNWQFQCLANGALTELDRSYHTCGMARPSLKY